MSNRHQPWFHKLQSRYRVDNVPILIRPFYYLISYLLGILLYLYLLVVHFTSQIQESGKEHLTPNQNYIYLFWHEFLYVYFCIRFFPRKMVYISHPTWHMKPIYVLLSFIGLNRFILGSTGYQGREAADQLVIFLKNGFSTFINPDGPHGPKRVLKKGTLHISLQSQISIVPARISCTKYFSLDWDEKQIPLPFGNLRLEYGMPIHVTTENFDTIETVLKEAIG